MVALGPASVVVVAFPFSDLSGVKLRPAVILASAGREDWVLCQITSNPYSDIQAVRLTPDTFSVGALADVSFARPLKLFTAHESLMAKRVAVLGSSTFREILLVTLRSFQEVMPDEDNAR